MLATARGELARVVRLCAALCAGACSAVDAVESEAVRTSAGEAPAIAAQEESSAQLPGSLLVLSSAGWDAILVDPRDAGLRRALGMLDERLVELSAEIGKPPPPPTGAIELACEVLSSPFLLEVDPVAGAVPGAPPVRAQLTVQAASAAAAEGLAARVEALVSALSPGSTIASADASAELSGMKVAELPSARLFFGARERSLVVSLGEPRFDQPHPSAPDLPGGVEPVLTFAFDAARLGPILESELDGPDGPALRRELESFGLLGDDPLAIALAWGHGVDRDHMACRVRSWKKMASRLGLLASGPLPREELALIPADATFVYVERMEPRSILRALDWTSAGQAAERLQGLEASLGFELEADLLAPLGETIGLYLSDTTGGGGLPSAVLFAAVDDEARLGVTLARAAERLDAWARETTSGRIRVQSFKPEGLNCLGLAFPGLPVPIAPSVALLDGHLFAAATPEALIAALHQARAGGGGLLAHPAFRSPPPGSLDDLQGLRFLDTPRLLRDGYETMSLFAAALANGVRSRSDAARDPGPVLPPFAELAASARPSIFFSRLEGDDLVGVAECDRSVVARATALAGAFKGGMILTGLLATLVIPPIIAGPPTRGFASTRARAMADIVAIENAANLFAIESQGRYPSSIEELVTPDMDGMTYLDRTDVPMDPWGNPYGYELPDARSMPRIFTLGADGAPGGDGEDRDIDNFQIRRGE